MKKHTRFFAFLLVAVMLTAMVPFTASASVLSGKKIVAFGDSLTHYGATDSGNTDVYGNKIYSDAYPDYLSNILGTTVVNAGVGGNTTDMAVLRLWSEVINEKPDIVLICFGMNDQAFNASTTGSSITPLDPYRANLEMFIKEIRNNGGEPVIITPNPVCDDSGYFTYYGDPNYNYGLLPDYCNAMREVAIEYGCGYIDINAEFSALSSMKDYMTPSDGVHQNDAGRRLYAQLISEYLYAAYDGTNKATMTIRCSDENGKVLTEYQIVGAAGSVVTVPSPKLPTYTAITADINTTFVNGAVHKFTYSSDIEALVEEAGKTIATDYDAAVALQLQMAYSDVMAQYNAATPNFQLMEKAAIRMKNLVNAKGNSELLLSSGKPYTTTAPNYYQWLYPEYLNLAYVDDKIRLTDGKMSEPNGGCSAYAAWTSDLEVIIDMEEITEADVFRGYFASDEWGVVNPTEMKVYYLDSSSAWVEMQGNTVLTNLKDGSDADANNTNGVWSLDKLTFTANESVAAQKFKLVFTKVGSFVWLDEVEVALRVSPDEVSDPIINGANTPVVNASTNLFTPGFNVSNVTANLNFTANVRAKWDGEKNAYIITEVFTNNGSTKTETLASDEIILAAHYGDGGENKDTFLLLQNARVGQALFFNGVDMGNGVAIAATFELEEYSGDSGSEPGENKEGNLAFGKDHTENGFIVAGGMWPANYSAKLTDGIAANALDYHYQNQWFGISMSVDDDGVANTDANGICAIIIDLESTSAITDIKVNTFVGDQDGIAKPKSIKAYVADSADGQYTLVGELKYGTAANDVAWAEISKDCRGRFVKIEVEIARYEDGVPYTYAFINEIEVYGTVVNDDDGNDPNPNPGGGSDDPGTNPEPSTFIRGDVNLNGKIDSRDYLLLKRAYFGTTDLNEIATLAADVNKNDKIDSRDYMLLKRAYFGTYTIEQ